MSSILFVELTLRILELLKNHHLVLDGCKQCLSEARWCPLTNYFSRSTTSACCLSLQYLQDRYKSLCYFAASCSWVGRLENFI